MTAGKSKKIWKTVIITLIVLAVGVGALFASYGIIYSSARKEHMPVQRGESAASEKIHFLQTGSSDAILLESDGKFALVDAGEDSDNPRGFESLELDGYEDKVVEYLKKVAADENGVVTLEFVVGTHAHSDHLGGFDTVISDPDIIIKEAYLKPYDENRIAENEVEKWDNLEVYTEMLEALNERGIPVITELEGRKLSLGSFEITIYNGAVTDFGERVGENDNSLALLVTDGRYKAMLMGDVNINHDVEKNIGKAVGKIDLLKVGHHGYDWSTGTSFLMSTKPEIAIFTNEQKWVSFPVKFRLAMTTHTAMYSTGEFGGIIAAFEENGIKLISDIH